MSNSMEKDKLSDAINQGNELGKLAKVLFDRATASFYTSMFIEIVAGSLGVIIGLMEISDKSKVIFAVFGFLLLAIAYYLRIKFEAVYENAETMRRQSVLAIGLGWKIGRIQFSDWRMFAGKKALQETEKNPLSLNYYASGEEVSPKRLLEMTQESAFWTRHLYCYLSFYVWLGFSLAILLFASVLTFSASGYIQQGLATKIVYITYLILPLILALDILNWGFRLNRLIASIRSIERGLETMEDEKFFDEKQILRLVFEYNCQLTQGFPIPGVFFNLYHDNIQSLWEKR